LELGALSVVVVDEVLGRGEGFLSRNTEMFREGEEDGCGTQDLNFRMPARSVAATMNSAMGSFPVSAILSAALFLAAEVALLFQAFDDGPSCLVTLRL